MKFKTNKKHFIAIFCALFIFLASSLGYFLYLIFFNNLQNSLKVISSKELVEAESLNQLIYKEFNSVISDLRIIAASHELTDFINRKAKDTTNLNHDFYNISSEKELFDQIRYIDKTGQELIRINYNDGKPSVVEAENLQNKSKRYYFIESFKLDKNEIYISPLDLNIEKDQIELPQKPMIRFAIPVFNSQNVKTGIVLINYLAKTIIDLLESIGSRGISEFHLLNSKGFWLKGPNKEQEWGFMYPNKSNTTFEYKYKKEWAIINSKDFGQIKTNNGLFTFQTFYPRLSSIESSLFKYKPRDLYYKIVRIVPEATLIKNSKNISSPLAKLYLIMLFIFVIVSAISAYYIENKIRIDKDRQKLIAELQSALNEINSLQGILPICSKCRKIRDDQGYWNLVEEYIEKHLDVQFSHGLCESCGDELYGDQEWYQKKMRKNKKPEDK